MLKQWRKNADDLQNAKNDKFRRMAEMWGNFQAKKNLDKAEKEAAEDLVKEEL